MAKKKRRKKRTKEKVEEVKLPEPLGWGFWLICFIVLFGPMTYGGYLLSTEDRRATLLPWVLGFSGAALVAGLLSAGINFVIDFRARRILKNRGRAK